jgi:hypothetical protein
MATPSIMRKVSSLGSAIKSLPLGEEEAESLREKQANVQSVSSPVTQEEPKKQPYEVSPQDRINPKAQYGDRGSEKRISPDVLKEMSKPLGSLPSYDQGTDYVPEDQIAKLHQGEAVVPAEENPNAQPAPEERLMAKNSAPDTHVHVHMGSDPMGERGPQPEDSKVDEQLTPREQTQPKPSPLGNAMKTPLQGEAPLGGQREGATPQGTAPQGPAPEETLHPDTHALLNAQRAMLNKEIQDSSAKGDLVTAGTAKLALLELNKNNPYGSQANHPGALGRIGHVLARAGNIAGDFLVPNVMREIPGTDLNKAAQAQTAIEEIKEGEQKNTQQADTAFKEAEARNAGVGKTVNERTYQDLLHGGPNGGPRNDENGQPYNSQTALMASQGTGKGVDEETIQSLMKTNNPDTGKPYTRLEAEQDVLTMKAGTKPANPKLQELTDYMKAHNLQDTPANRDLARAEVEKRNTTAKQEAALPYAEHKIRLQSQLSQANASLNQIQADSLARGKTADEFLQKENARHNLRVTQIDSAQDALDKSDTNELAASIVPVLATMTESNEQGIKRLNPQELSRFMPKSSGDARQWFEANYDKLTAGQIPEQYRGDLRELLNGVAAEEEQQYNANKTSIDQTLRQGAVAPVVNKEGKANSTEKSKPAGEAKPPNGATHTGTSSVDGKKYYLDAQGKKLGPVPENK